MTPRIECLLPMLCALLTGGGCRGFERPRPLADGVTWGALSAIEREWFVVGYDECSRERPESFGHHRGASWSRFAYEVGAYYDSTGASSGGGVFIENSD